MEQNNNQIASDHGNIIIAFANRKGGVGKTTLCGMFADYLVDRGIKTFVVDADSQQSIYNQRQSDIMYLKEHYPDKSPEELYAYNVYPASIGTSDEAVKLMSSLRELDCTCIIDSPGSLDVNGILAMLANCDYVICPFYYDRGTMEVTRNFIGKWWHLTQEYPNIKTKFIFIPNRKKTRIGTLEEKAAWEATDAWLSNFGEVLSAQAIGDYKSVMNYNTVNLTSSQLEKVSPCFDKLYNIIYGGQTDDIK